MQHDNSDDGNPAGQGDEPSQPPDGEVHDLDPTDHDIPEVEAEILDEGDDGLETAHAETIDAESVDGTLEGDGEFGDAAPTEPKPRNRRGLFVGASIIAGLVTIIGVVVTGRGWFAGEPASTDSPSTIVAEEIATDAASLDRRSARVERSIDPLTEEDGEFLESRPRREAQADVQSSPSEFRPSEPGPSELGRGEIETARNSQAESLSDIAEELGAVASTIPGDVVLGDDIAAAVDSAEAGLAEITALGDEANDIVDAGIDALPSKDEADDNETNDAGPSESLVTDSAVDTIAEVTAEEDVDDIAAADIVAEQNLDELPDGLTAAEIAERGLAEADITNVDGAGADGNAGSDNDAVTVSSEDVVADLPTNDVAENETAVDVTQNASVQSADSSPDAAAKTQAALNEVQTSLGEVSQALDAERARAQALQEQLVRQQQSFEAQLAQQNAGFEGELAALRQQIEDIGAPAIDVEAASASLMLVELSDTVASGDPFATQLTALSRFVRGAPELDQMKPYAPTGVATSATLQRDFRVAAREGLAAALRQSPEGLGGRISAIFGLRPATPQAGDGPRAVISRMEAAVQEADFATALRERNTLNEDAQLATADWAKAAEQFVSVDGAMATLRARLISAQGG